MIYTTPPEPPIRPLVELLTDTDGGYKPAKPPVTPPRGQDKRQK